MLEILEMSAEESEDLLGRSCYGHFACAREGQPYVVPINYAFAKPDIYIYTTAGLKSEIIKQNPLVCLQVEERDEEGLWKSVVVTGEAIAITDPVEREKAVALIKAVNPPLLPALAIRWTNNWIRENVELVYRVSISSMSGLQSSEVRRAAASARPTPSPAIAKPIDPQVR